MIRQILLLFVLLGLTWALLAGENSPGALAHAQTTLTLGFVILAAHALGQIVMRFGVPAITAHLILGVAAGPHGLGLISTEATDNLSLIDGIALALIALTAGGELVISQLRPAMRSILTISLALTVLVFGVGALTTWLLLGQISEASRPAGQGALAFCLLMGVMAVALSPSATIAVITECKAKGRLTDIVLGVTVILDVFVIILFAGIFAISKTLASPGSPDVLGDLGALLLKLLLSVVVGLVLAALLALALPRAGRQIPLIVAGFSLLVATGAPLADLDPLILCIATGLIVRNFTPRGREMIRGIESISPLFYAIFFTIVAAGLDLNAVGMVWPIVAALIAGRLVATWVATWAAGGLVRDSDKIRRLGWLGFISQAGVSLGLASLVADAFADWGEAFETVVVSLTAGNLFIGPILMKIALVKADEVGKSSDDGGAHG